MSSLGSAAPPLEAFDSVPRSFDQTRQRGVGSILTALLVLLLVGLAAGWLATQLVQLQRQQEARRAIQQLGGELILFSWESTEWLEPWLELEATTTVASVVFPDGNTLTDQELSRLTSFPELEHLDLSNTAVTDAGLKQLTGLVNLRQLGLSGTAISDQGLLHLTPLTQLEELDLSDTPVTDACLGQLARFTGLRSVDLSRTQVTLDGIVAQFGPQGPPFFYRR